MDEQKIEKYTTGLEVAIIGMAGRFPGANNIQTFWQNLVEGKESVSFFDREESLQAGISPHLLDRPEYVRAHGVMDKIEDFDPKFFNYTAEEAAMIDPQHRIFTECCWEALEHSGYTMDHPKNLVGIYAGTSMSTYLLYHLLSRHEEIDQFEALLGNDKDCLCTRVSYKLNLEGPSVTIQSACSTSLVAVHVACQALLAGECNIALAGGVSIKLPQKGGYLFVQDSIGSPDGRCRAFDAQAAGTVGGNGCGVVALKLLTDAIKDRDTIHAVIKGSATNNDGSQKVAYTAPREEGQIKVIRTAQEIAEVHPDTITYIETHGTGTTLGDPIEAAALKQAFKEAGVTGNQYCAIGSVKTNIGHNGTASGVIGLIKTVMMLKNKLIPASLHYHTPHPDINFEQSPFFVNTHLKEFKPQDGYPLRAGVSSFGIGGTNAHVVLEEAPTASANQSETIEDLYLLPFSAKTESALFKMRMNLREFIKENPAASLGNIAYTLQTGKIRFPFREAMVCHNREEAIRLLSIADTHPQISRKHEQKTGCPVSFMFPGQGSQYVNMGKELYETIPLFKTIVNQGIEYFSRFYDTNYRVILFPSTKIMDLAKEKIKQTQYAQSSIFLVSYALAKSLMEWGIQPEAMIGHSIGEYVAACLSGVFSFEDALKLVAIRGQLMNSVDSGKMLSVPLSRSELSSILPANLDIAAENAPNLCVVSGSLEEIENFQRVLVETKVESKPLKTSHAFHSKMVEPILQSFRFALNQITFQSPTLPFISNLSGDWIEKEQCTSPEYWINHMRREVLFSKGIKTLQQDTNQVLIELGPGDTLCRLAQLSINSQKTLITSLPRADAQEKSGNLALKQALTKLWTAGVDLNWSKIFQQSKYSRIPLPTYPFERIRCWIEY
ncbi:MAG: type I polyketide synthase, partial [Desulfobacteraceae bacterium]